MEQLNLILFVFSAVLAATAWTPTSAKLVWKVKPQEYQIAKDFENVKLNCEFENANPHDPMNYFVIWYKDGSSQNFISLNNQLANLNATNYEIVGKYNLIIKNVTRNNSGIYTCQLFQSSELISSVNLTVLGNLNQILFFHICLRFRFKRFAKKPQCSLEKTNFIYTFNSIYHAVFSSLQTKCLNFFVFFSNLDQAQGLYSNMWL